jgi:pimeloyl-ACP methyl ester carboxylesterase
VGELGACIYVAGHELDPEFWGWLRAGLPDATRTVLPGGGHFPHLAHPAEFAKIVDRLVPR